MELFVQALKAFIPTVVNQLVVNIQRVLNMGVKKVVVTYLQPLGCLPRMTVVTLYQSCNDTQNAAVQFHNLLLQQAVDSLNNVSQGSVPFVILDLYTSFMSVLQNNSTQQGIYNSYISSLIHLTVDQIIFNFW